ncbi:MAG TPA: S9 family peptidase, partial [Methylibium sp.]
MKIFIKRWLALRAVVLAAAVSAAPVARAQPTVDDFFRAPAISDAELSPSGRYLAVGVGNMTGRIQLGVIDLDSRDRPAVVVAGFSDADINHFQWLNDERLVLTVADTDRASGFLRGNGLWAVNRDGKDFRQLIERAWTIKEITARKIRLLEPDHALLGV